MMSQKKFLAIGFDYGGVIGGDVKTGVNFTHQICEALDMTAAEYNDVYFSHNHLINNGEIETYEEFWRMILAKINKLDRLDQVRAIISHTANKFAEFDETMMELLKKIRLKGYKLGLLSNNTKYNGNLLRKRGLDKYFDAFLISADIGSQKPSIEAFQYLAKSLGVRMEEMIFVDDADKSLSTAHECGFQPVKFENQPKLVRELHKLGVVV